MLAHYAQPCGRHSLVCGLVECALGARGRRSSQRSVGLPSACHKILFLARGSRTLLLRQYTGWEVSSCTSPRSNSCFHELIQDVSRASNTNLVGGWSMSRTRAGTKHEQVPCPPGGGVRANSFRAGRSHSARFHCGLPCFLPCSLDTATCSSSGGRPANWITTRMSCARGKYPAYGESHQHSGIQAWLPSMVALLFPGIQ